MFANAQVVELLREQVLQKTDKQLRALCNEFLQEYYYEEEDVLDSSVRFEEAIKTIKQLPELKTPGAKLLKLREAFDVAIAE